jgi:hypothetical protein
VARADRRRAGSLASLLRRIGDDADALDGLVFAYLRLPRSGRWALAHAALRDAAEPEGALGAFILAEGDPAFRRRLARLLSNHVPMDASAWSRGTPTQGEACLSQSFAGRSETLRIRWSAGEIEYLGIEATKDASLAGGLLERDTACVIDALTPLLWRYIRRGGALPTGADRFARFFSIAPSRAAQW